jgi:molecular chaperone DnaK (HSP70)
MNTIFGMKRMMGRDFDDPEAQKYMRWLPYEVVRSKEGKA